VANIGPVGFRTPNLLGRTELHLASKEKAGCMWCVSVCVCGVCGVCVFVCVCVCEILLCCKRKVLCQVCIRKAKRDTSRITGDLKGQIRSKKAQYYTEV
jgi:hypothetical protein